VQDRGLFSDTPLIPYLEFYWANFFREKLEPKYFSFFDTETMKRNTTIARWCRMRVYDQICYRVPQEEILSSLLPDAIDMVSSPAARSIPGFLDVPLNGV